MQCFVYKGSKREDSYLFVTREDDFSSVPESLVALLGSLELVMQFNLAEKSKLAGADIDVVRRQLQDMGFYLQMPRHFYKDAT